MRMQTTPSVVIRILSWIIALTGGTFFGVYFDLIYFRDLFFNPFFHIILFIVGIILMNFSFRATAVGGKELAQHGRAGNIPRLETNRLVTTGIYSCFRHPMLFGLSLLPLSLACIIGSPTFIFFIAPFEMASIIFMVLTFEEKEARTKFGDKYIKYAQKTPIVSTKKECYKRLFLK